MVASKFHTPGVKHIQSSNLIPRLLSIVYQTPVLHVSARVKLQAQKAQRLVSSIQLARTLSSFFIWWSPYLVFTLFGDGADETPSLGASVSSSMPRILFPPHFASAGLEDEGVGATECAAVGVSTPLALFEPLQRIGGFGFPLRDLGV